MRRLAVIGALLILAGCSGGDDDDDPAVAPPASTTDTVPSVSPTSSGGSLMQVRGTVTLIGNLNNAYLASDLGTCTGWNEYDDINIGAEVIITGADGETLGLGELGLPMMEADDPADPSRACVIEFEVRSVPRGEGFYGVQVAQRAPVQFAEDDMGHVEITYP